MGFTGPGHTSGQGTHGTWKTGKTGKMAQKIPCQGKHREFGNFVKTQGKHREFGNFVKTQGILSEHREYTGNGKTQGILLAQFVNVLILKVKDIAIVAAKKSIFFKRPYWSAKSVLCM